MFQKKLNRDTILHYSSMLLGAAVLSFGLFNVHSQSKITEGGILGLTLFLHHWTGISPGIFSFLLDMTCYIIGFRLLGTDFLKNAIFPPAATHCCTGSGNLPDRFCPPTQINHLSPPSSAVCSLASAQA